MTSDVGGVLEILTILFKLMASWFASLRIKAIVSSRLVHMNQGSNEKFFGTTNLCEKQLKDSNLYKSSTGEVRLFVPPSLIANYVFYLCACKRTKFSTYHALIDRGFDNFNEDLDLLNFTKRIRMYGVSLYFLLSSKQRKLAGHLTNFRPIREKKIIDAENADSWETLENLTVFDWFHFAFLLRFAHYFK